MYKPALERNNFMQNTFMLKNMQRERRNEAEIDNWMELESLQNNFNSLKAHFNKNAWVLSEST